MNRLPRTSTTQPAVPPVAPSAADLQRMEASRIIRRFEKAASNRALAMVGKCGGPVDKEFDEAETEILTAMGVVCPDEVEPSATELAACPFCGGEAVLD